MSNVITIDNQTFQVGVSSIQRTSRIPDGPNSGTAKDGTRIRDVYGTFYDYAVQFDTCAGFSRSDYDNLYYLLTAPVPFHNITIPFGQSTISFPTYIESLDDRIILMADGTIWGNLTVTFTPKSPQRPPEGVVTSGN